MDSWTFIQSLGRDRLDALEDPPPFEEIARSIDTVMRAQCSHVDPCDEASGFQRLVVCVMIDQALFDLFFNSYNGYRGSYFRSPSEGFRMNAHLLRILAPRLIEFGSHENIPVDLASKSLLASSAKCWLAEVGRGFCSKCEGDWSKPKNDSPEIFNGRWDIAQAPNARFGRKAPYLEKLRVMGAFVNQVGEQYVAKGKSNRAQEIHDAGWS